MLNKLENKKLIINKWDGDKKLYTWEINGDDVNQYDDIDTLVEFYSNSDKEMNHLTNYAKYLYFNNHLHFIISQDAFFVHSLALSPKEC